MPAPSSSVNYHSGRPMRRFSLKSDGSETWSAKSVSNFTSTWRLGKALTTSISVKLQSTLLDFMCWTLDNPTYNISTSDPMLMFELSSLQRREGAEPGDGVSPGQVRMMRGLMLANLQFESSRRTTRKHWLRERQYAGNR